MSASLDQSRPEPPSVAHSVGGQALQTIQGVYYAFAGICAALAIQPGAAPVFRWVAPALALAVAGFGVALARSGVRKQGPFIGTKLSMSVAIVLCFLSSAGFASGGLPPLFLLDAGSEFGFACCWAVALFTRIVPASDPS